MWVRVGGGDIEVCCGFFFRKLSFVGEGEKWLYKGEGILVEGVGGGR